MTTMFRILGTSWVTNAGQTLKLTGSRQRALLAALLVRAEQPVSIAAIIDAIWGARPPASAVANVHTYVNRLRTALADIGLSGRLVTASGAYQLLVEPGELDSQVFQLQANQARAALLSGDAAAAVSRWRQAWSLWRGRPLEDVPLAGWLEDEAAGLEEMTAVAREDYADARLATGQYGDLITELGALVRQLPLREGLWWRLMLAQHRAGSGAGALETYRALRRVLAAELGVEPCDQIQKLHQEILSGRRSGSRPDDTRGPARPMQLPPDVEHFTGREAEAAQLRRLLTRRQPKSGAVVAIVGKAGVGKTALAVRLARELTDHFDGGQLYVRLGGAGSTPRESSTVLAEFLTSLAVHPDAVPENLDARAAMYRSELAARKVLIVLDDAVSMAQVRPLLPGSARSAVLITSRVELVEMADAHTVNLDVLDADHAVLLLASIAGPARVAAEADAARALAGYCGNLPLALRIAASRLARRAHWTVGRLAERLAREDDRLNELRIDDLDARASFTWSYEALDEAQRRAFRLLGLIDVPDFPGWVAAALLDVPVPEAEEIVDSLADVHLLETCGVDQAGQSRYRFHDLLRVFARERAVECDTPADRIAALRRVFEAWLALASRAEQSLPSRFLKVRVTSAYDPRVDAGRLSRLLADPVAWLEAERDALVGVVEQALALDMTTLAGETASVLATLFDLHGHYDLWRHTHELALAAARRAAADRSQAILHQGLGALAFYRERFRDAYAHFGEARRIFIAIGETRGLAYADLGLGTVQLFRGRDDDAVIRLTEARSVFSQCADTSGEAFTLQGLGIACRHMGQLGDALAYLERALGIFRRLSIQYGQACVLFSLGVLYDAQDEPAAAEAALSRAGELFRASACPRDEALALRVRAAFLAQRGDVDLASALIARSLTVLPQADESGGTAAAMDGLGRIAHQDGRRDAAAAYFGQALHLYERLDLPFQQARTITALGDLAADRGDASGARAAWRRAHRLFQTVDAAEARELAIRLGDDKVASAHVRTS
ncbi:AfsR/SARP family transcriptional regulator [Fodinicola acaciae]|uniref:AfsR/SARP family transcriptional regulator n=1 Tax=Fodinicola acaciae TaxID=2681555 RepID=UPI0013D51768|nr:AfsR/SARP family transcriptional regulator [Fodinicola acaciae]